MAGPIAPCRPAPLTDCQYMPTVLVQGHCYAELAVSSLAVAKTTASTHCAYTHGGMARLSRPGWLWLNTEMAYPRTVTHPILTRPGVEQLYTLININEDQQ